MCVVHSVAGHDLFKYYLSVLRRYSRNGAMEGMCFHPEMGIVDFRFHWFFFFFQPKLVTVGLPPVVLSMWRSTLYRIPPEMAVA